MKSTFVLSIFNLGKCFLDVKRKQIGVCDMHVVSDFFVKLNLKIGSDKTIPCFIGMKSCMRSPYPQIHNI